MTRQKDVENIKLKSRVRLEYWGPWLLLNNQANGAPL